MYKKNSINYVFFDLDGTLIDSNGVHNRLDVSICRLLGEKKSKKSILIEREYFFKNYNFKGGDIYLDYCNYLCEKYSSNLSGHDLLNQRRIMSYELSKNIKLKPYASNTIKYLYKTGVKLVLATVSRKETIDIYNNENKNIANRCNFNKYFEFIVTKNDVKNKKPDPEVYNFILKKMNIKNKNKCIVVEDSLSGIKAAKSAGLTVIAIYDKYSDNNREEIKKLSDYQVNDHKELIDLFKKMNGDE